MPTITEISATEFKAKCLQLLDEVSEGHGTLVVTKHGKPVAKVVPISDDRPKLRGAGVGTMKIMGDIVNFDTSDDWEVLKETGL